VLAECEFARPGEEKAKQITVLPHIEQVLQRRAQLVPALRCNFIAVSTEYSARFSSGFAKIAKKQGRRPLKGSKAPALSY
jgi:hypothetical protein